VEVPALAGLRQSPERRQLTVMFADLVSSTEMSRQLDPEDLRAVNRAYQTEVTRAIETYDGFVARYMGDGVLAYFGYPRAHGDDPERAVRAAIEAVAAVTRLSATVGAAKGVRLQTRVGIATGLVVVGDLIGSGPASERAVVGETPNLAARMQGIAQPDTVVVADSTRQRLSTGFRLESLGQRDLKGFSEPVPAFRVLERIVTVNTTRLLGAQAVVGRGYELQLLQQQWELAEAGNCRRVVISGRAGLGKTRLVEGLLEYIGRRPHLRVSARASAHHRRSPFHAVARWFARRARIRQHNSPHAKLEKLKRLAARAPDPEATLPVLAAILNVAYDQAEAPTPLNRHAQTLDVLVDFIRSVAKGRPMVLIAGDAQWLDPSSRALMERLSREPKVAALLIVTHRPEIEVPWPLDERTLVLELRTLSDEAVEELVLARTGGRHLPESLLRQIIERSGGVPMFALELTRALIDQGLLYDEDGALHLVDALPSLAVPATLQDTIMARLDRLGFHKVIVQIASVIGHDVPRELLAAVAELSEQELLAAITRLLDMEVLVTDDGRTLSFEQSLLREIAYESLLRTRRSEIHAKVAALLPGVMPALVAEQPELLAHHLMESEQGEAALGYWVDAADRAERRLALVEAMEHLRFAVAAIQQQDPSDALRRTELAIRLRLVELSRTVDRQAQAMDDLDVAAQLAEKLGDHAGLSAVHHQLGNVLFLLGEIERAIEEQQHALDAADEIGSPEHQARALGGLGDAWYGLGRMVTAHAHFTSCVELARENGLQRIEAANMPLVAWCAVWMGRLEEGLERAREAVGLAQRAGHTRAQMVAWGGVAFALTQMGDFAGARQAGGHAVRLAKQLGSPMFHSAMALQAATATWLDGDHQAARRMARGALGVVQAEGYRLAGPALLALTARFTQDPGTRRSSLLQGEAMLADGTVGHNHLWFRNHAMDALLASGEWDEVLRHADALEAHTLEEPLLWADAQIARGRALAHAGRDGLTEAVTLELETVRDQLVTLGLLAHLPGVTAALDTEPG
jgi:class 3 adenylate cyclase/tetratricopeptide (TPR) repeat protein